MTRPPRCGFMVLLNVTDTIVPDTDDTVNCILRVAAHSIITRSPFFKPDDAETFSWMVPYSVVAAYPPPGIVTGTLV